MSKKARIMAIILAVVMILSFVAQMVLAFI